MIESGFCRVYYIVQGACTHCKRPRLITSPPLARSNICQSFGMELFSLLFPDGACATRLLQGTATNPKRSRLATTTYLKLPAVRRSRQDSMVCRSSCSSAGHQLNDAKIFPARLTARSRGDSLGYKRIQYKISPVKTGRGGLVFSYVVRCSDSIR